MCILSALVRAREVGVSSRNVVSRTFPHFYQSMLTAMHMGKTFLTTCLTYIVQIIAVKFRFECDF